MTIEEVFLAVLEITEENARKKYLDEACGDDANFRKEIEGLLAAHHQSGRFLDVPVAEQIQADSSPPESQPSAPGRGTPERDELGITLDGKYKLIECIGEGGMGRVFLARQVAPLLREVAVKVVKTGMDSKAILARFDAERQALAIMDHPNIAKVLDAGTTSTGQPYFVMELVRGLPITKFCDEQKLTPRQRLELFVPVCQAIQHAHQKGIIHRDIKPSNVLVASSEERAMPKVIDFGVAKAVVGSTPSEQSMMTGFGAVVGTPEYMSPEQASLDNLDIDTRSDVYSLGVLLYELLTGTTPVDHKSLIRSGLLEVLRIVREVEAPKPSEKLSSVDNLPNVAANRGMEPAHLSKSMKGELDWVVLKALEKDRTRRYETASALGRDVQRYLADEFVEARPPSRNYRFKKFVRRHRGSVLTATLLLLTLVGGTLGTTWGLVKSQQNETVALAAAAEEKTAKEREKAQRLVAENTRARTLEVLDAMVSEVTGDSLATQKEISAEQKKFLQSVLGYYQELRSEKGEDEASLRRQAQAARQVGKIEYRLGRKQEAAAAIRLARDSFASLAADFPNTSEFRQELARCHIAQGHLFVDLGQRDEALEHYRNGLTIQQKLVTEFPNVAEYRSDLAQGHANFGSLLFELGQVVAASQQFQSGLVILEKLAADFPDVLEYRRDLARSHYNLGNLVNSSGQRQAALQHYQKALELQEKLATDSPAVGVYRQELARTHNNLGNLLNKLGQLSLAQEQNRKAIAIQEKLVTDFPTIALYRASLALSYDNQATMLDGPAQRSTKMELYRKAMALQQKLVTDFPTIPLYRANLALSQQGLGQLLAEDGECAEGEASYRQGLLTQEKLAAEFPTVPAYRQDLARSHYNLGIMLDENTRLAAAEEQYRMGLALQEKLAAEFPANPAYLQELARSHNKLGILLKARGQFEMANEQHRLGLGIREKLVDLFPDVLHYRLELGGSYCNYGNTQRDVGNPAESVSWYKKGIQCLQPLHEKDPRDPLAKQFLRNSHAGRAQAHHRLGQYVEALADWDRTLLLTPTAQQPSFRPGRVASLLGAGRVTEALSEVAELTRSSQWNAAQWYSFACVYAVASGKTPDKKTEYGDRAMLLLQTAVNAGFKNTAHMKEDTDLDSLRDREDFQKLVATLETKDAKTPSKMAPKPQGKE
jgi:eukaryotic-like serine/threonine-protein kinase